MRDFLLLLKCDLRKLVGGKNKKQGGKIVLTAGLLVFFAILILAMSVLYTAMFAVLLPNENKHLALSIVMLLYFMIFLFSTVGTSKILFGAKDYDFLSSLPIKPQTVILSKIAYVYILGFLGALVSVAPSVITYIIITQSGAIVLLNALLVIPFIPLVPLFIGLIVGTVVNILMSKVKRKSLFGIIFAILFLAGYFYLVLGTGLGDSSDEDLANSIVKISGVLLPFSFVAKGILGNYLYILVFDICTFAVCAVYVLTLGKYYKQTNELITAKRRGTKVDLSKQKSESILGALVKKEIKTYFSNSTIVINSIIGPVMAIVLGAVFLFKGGLNSLAGEVEFTAEELTNLKEIAKLILPYVPFFFIGISTYASFAISLEGKTLWFVKSLPIKAKDWLNAKLITNLIITMPAGVISAILFGIGLQVAWYDVVIAVILVVLYSFVGAFLGLAVNMKYNNFTWNNPAEVVKRGASVTICMFVGMLAVIPIVAVQVFCSFISAYLGFALVGTLLVSFIFLFYYLAYKNADAKLLKM